MPDVTYLVTGQTQVSLPCPAFSVTRNAVFPISCSPELEITLYLARCWL